MHNSFLKWVTEARLARKTLRLSDISTYKLLGKLKKEGEKWRHIF